MSLFVVVLSKKMIFSALEITICVFTKVRIDLSNKDLQSRVSSIGANHDIAPTEEDQRRDADNKLSEFLGNLPPVAVLPSIKNMQKENEDNWCYLGKWF